MQLMRWSAARLTYLRLVLFVLSFCSSHAQSPTPLAMSARARALRDIETSQPSSLDAVPVWVDRSLDRRVDADVRELSSDPSLTGLGADEPDGRVTGLSTSSGDVQIRSRTTMPAATSWSHVPVAELTTQAESASSDVPEHPADPPILLPAQVIVSEAGDRSSADISVSDPGTNSSRQARLPGSRVQQREKVKRQPRALEKKSDQQCSQLRSGEAECRLKLKKTNAGMPHDDLQTWR